jgi:hypothetical protein
MASKDTGFHPSDPDWTRGRAAAVADADALARRQSSMGRAVAMREPARLGQEWDANYEAQIEGQPAVALFLADMAALIAIEEGKG